MTPTLTFVYRRSWLYLIITIPLLVDKILLARAQNQSNFLCNSTNDCSQKTLICNQNSNCSITCSTSGTEAASCVDSTFICPQGPYHCHLMCVGKMGQCGGSLIDASRVTEASLTVGILATAGFESGHAICPISGACTFFSMSPNGKGLRYSTINASNMISGDLIIEADDSVNSNAEYMKVECPPNGKCIVDVGTSPQSCHRCSIIAQPTTTLLNITSQGNSALESADIFCPLHKNGDESNCIINDPGNYERVFINLDIRSVESYTNLQLICSFCSNTDRYSITMYCMSDYSESCDLSWSIFSDEWQCSDRKKPCQDWTVDATRNPTIATENPTKHPTDGTLSPTKYPVKTLTNRPTLNPTKIPTAAPTKGPTIVPTSYPTSNVTIIHTVNPTETPTKTMFASSSATSNPRIIPTTIRTLNSTAVPTLESTTNSVWAQWWLNVLIILIICIIILIILMLLVRCCYLSPKQEAQNAVEVHMSHKGDTRHFDATDEDAPTQGDIVPTYITRDGSVELQMKRAQENALQVQYWLENVVRLPLYYDVMIRNGYDSLAIIREINSITELKDIGIESVAHQSVILQAIGELRHENDVHIGRMLSKTKDNDPNPIHGLQKMTNKNTQSSTVRKPKLRDLLPFLNTAGNVHVYKEEEGSNRKQNEMNVEYNMNAECDEIVIGDDEITADDEMGQTKYNMSENGYAVVMGEDELRMISGPMTVEGMNTEQCTDCAQVKEGKIYDGDGLFYCNQCYDAYDNDVNENPNLPSDENTPYI